jgi:hypothetical protein
MARRQKRQTPSRKRSRSGAIKKRSSTKFAKLRSLGLTARQRKIREKALHAVSRSRRKQIPLKTAAREEHVAMRSIAKYIPAAIRRNNAGEIVATRGDRYRRDVILPSAMGEIPISVYSSRDASLVAKYRLALAKYARGADESVLRPFVGLRVGGHELPTDPALVRAILAAAEFQPEKLYAAIGGAG